ncbi:MAG: hypothetical protein R3A80_06830 [Bdellovibrionota bacterium]
MKRQLFLSLAAATIMPSHALVYSSSLNFKLTQSRISAEDITAIPTYKADKLPEKSLIEKMAQAAVPASKKKSTARAPSVDAIDLTELRGDFPTRHPQQARIFVVDEEALLNGKLKAISNASIYMINPSLEGPRIETSATGLAKIPYPFSESLRFFVRAQGYMLGMGYATFGNVTLVPMVSEKRFSTLARSLNISVPAGQLAVMGRALDVNLKGIADSQISFGETNPRVVYSGPFFGGIPGYFTDDFRKTDSQGAFIANGVSRSKHSIRVLNSKKAVPAFTYDFSGIPESVRFVSLALQNGPSINLSPSVVDGESFERPNCGLVGTLLGHKVPGVPDEDGVTWIESKVRPVIDELTINTDKCGDYLPTFVSQASNDILFPPVVGLFTTDQIQGMLSILNRTWSKAESLVLGHVYPQKDFKHEPIKETSLSIINSYGEKARAEILYFDNQNNLDPRRTQTDSHFQNFAVLGLEDGEYHFVYRDGLRGSGLGIQVVRVRRGGITQVDF